jgi:methylated-DNA-protein-cysteine methyltransferase-like protein
VFDDLRAVVRRIPKGKVSTYGEVAVAAGHPRGSRQVAWALKQFDPTLPWHRVIGKGGKILLRGANGVEQVHRLEAEGITVHGTRIDMKRYGADLSSPSQQHKSKAKSPSTGKR